MKKTPKISTEPNPNLIDPVINSTQSIVDHGLVLNMLDHAPAFICVLRGKNHVFELANKNYLQIIGHRDVIGKPVADALPEVVEQGFIDLLDSVYTNGKPFVGNEIPVHLNRSKNSKLEELYVNFVYEPIFNKDKTVIGIFVHGVDVTNQVIARKLAEENEQKYRTLFNSIDEGFCLIEMEFDEDGRAQDYRFIEVNAVFEKQTGLKDPVGKTARELIPNLEDHWFEIYGKIAKTGKSERFINGSEAMGRWFDVYANRVGGKGSNQVAILFSDITSKKLAENEMQFQKSLLEVQKEVSPMGILIVSPEGKMISYNKRFTRMWKFPKDVMDSQIDAIALQAAQQQLKNPDEFLKKVTKIYATKQTAQDMLYFKDGRIFERYGSPVQGGKMYYGYAWFFLDVTERENLVKQKDEFLGIASHELKTPVTSIKAYGQVLESIFRKKNDLTSAEMLQKMDTQVDRLTILISDLLDVTKIQSGRMQFNRDIFDLSDLIHERVEEIQRTTEKHHIRVEIEKSHRVCGDRERIGQVITNFLTNAIKYSPKSDLIEVTSSHDSSSIQVCVRDFGVGIPKSKQLKVFEQFYRVNGDTRNTFPGLGLGLYISSEIIKRENGKIWVESTKGKGSNFCFSLPIFKQK